jgi:hypothetical protein
MTPCDLHVLNTPPAFVLSQNQTLRKKFGWRLFQKGKAYFQIDLAGRLPPLPEAGLPALRAPLSLPE